MLTPTFRHWKSLIHCGAKSALIATDEPFAGYTVATSTHEMRVLSSKSAHRSPVAVLSCIV